MKHTIEIEGLPEGWEPVAYRAPKRHEKYYKDGTIRSAAVDLQWPEIVIKKKQPRRIVLEETEEENHLYESGQYAAFSAGEFMISGVRNKWREVKETEPSLNNGEPKLSLTVDECRNMSLSEINMKIVDFLKDK